MAVAVVRKKSQSPERPTLSPEKGSEILGILLLAAGIFLVLSLGTHHPQDPSLLHRVPEDGAHAHNWIGSVGAHISALAFGFFGLTCLLIPLFLLVAGWRRLRRKDAPKVVGRGFGAVLLLASVPALLHIGFGRINWLDGSVAAGGAFGVLLTELLESRLDLAGTLVVLGLAVACGLALVVQSTLGDLLASWRDRLKQVWQNWTLSRERRHERREKERNRRRVITKHLQRVAEEKQKNAPPPPESHRPSMAAAGVSVGAPPPDRLDLPLRPRVTEKKGEADFAVRRVSAPELPQGPRELDEDFPFATPPAKSSDSGAMPVPSSLGSVYVTPPARPRSAAPAPVPQKELPFVGEIAPGTLPPVNLLQMSDGQGVQDQAALMRLGEAIRSRCAEFGVEGTIEAINPGPVITVYELQPAPGVKVSQVVNLQDDLALALRAESVRIDRMSGRSTLGIEVPNKERSIIRLGTLLADERFKKSPSVLTMALGTDIYGEPYYADLATMPHLLVAGATGAGKSVGLQSMITSILYKATRDEVQFIFIDPKRIELGVYADIPHLKCEVVVEPKKAANALRWAVAEMERRYRLLAEVHVRSIGYYNRAISDPETQKRLSLSDVGDGLFTAADLKPMPYYVVVIDELADLMMVAAADVETSIARLAQMARAVGIHLIVATQRPSVDVLTGTIKANFPCRISFATASRHDSRTILDQVGSEKLLGKGDMLMMPPGSSRVMRLHGAYMSEQESAALIRWLKKLGKPELDPDVLKADEGEGGHGGGGDNDDDLYDEASRLVVAERQASASFLQRRMRVGFSRAARLIDMMERDGLLGPAQGSKPREVLVPSTYFEEVDVARMEE
ncbi:MAG TPA: DNA translocase FtsK [Thermoanaerobaculia bacterium]|jgi:S-DNA-T family DNA segregation ATPase FtsK/SpoIIIE|nr:DNA translocase FtsK [Thermoanaerobaculia bacterium]